MLLKNNENERESHYIGLKLINIFSMGTLGSAQMFLPIFLKKELGFGTDKIGYIFSIIPFVSFFAFPYWTTLIDKTGQYRKIMLQNMSITLVCILSIGAIPVLSQSECIRMIFVSFGCFGYAFFGYPTIIAIVDSLIFKILGNQKDLFGRQKIGLPIGFASSVFLTGFFIEKLDSNYALFLVFSAYNLSFLITILCIHIPTYQEPIEYGTFTEPERISIWELLKKPESIQFFVYIFFTGFSVLIVATFLYLFIQNDLHASLTMVGMLGPLGSITEITCFYFSKQLIKRFDYQTLLVASSSILILRCGIYIICTQVTYGVYLAMITQILHGIGYSMMWSAGALQADRLAPKHLKSTAQGLLNMSYNGIGSGIGTLAAGYVYETWGARWMWFMVAMISSISIILYTSSWIRKVLFLPLSNSFT